MPPGADHPGNAYNSVAYGETVDFWRPFTFEGNPAVGGRTTSRESARLKPGVTASQAQSELDALLADLGTRVSAARSDWIRRSIPLYREIVGPGHRMLPGACWARWGWCC